MSDQPPRPSVFKRILHRLRFAVYGRRAGLGQPVPVAALDHEYASGSWDHFFSAGEQTRYDSWVNLIRDRSLFPTHVSPDGVIAKPRLLDLGCGSGRLASLLNPGDVADYLGVDISEEGLRRARALDLPAPLNRFENHDFEKWVPDPESFEVITFNECLGYAPDPLQTARRFAETLPVGGVLIVSQFRTTNHVQFWRRLSREFVFPIERVVTTGQATWDLRVLKLRA